MIKSTCTRMDRLWDSGWGRHGYHICCLQIVVCLLWRPVVEVLLGSVRYLKWNVLHWFGPKCKQIEEFCFFSLNNRASIRRGVRNIFQIQRGSAFWEISWSLYDNDDHRKMFKHIAKRTMSRVQGWCEKMLSCSATEVVLEAQTVIQALQTYSMSCL